MSLGSMLASKLGEICERSIKSLQPISGIKLNRGDEKAFDEYNKSNRRSLIKMAGAIIAAISINVVSGVIVIALGFGS